MNSKRLDVALVGRGLASTRSQAENLIKLGQVKVNNTVVIKPSASIFDKDTLQVTSIEQYVSRAGLKLASVAKALKLEFARKVVLDVGSSTGGFTDYALQHGAAKVIAVDVGTDQMHASLRFDDRVELHEQTDIRDIKKLSAVPAIVVIDVSFISLREVLPAVVRLASPKTEIVAMVKPQFEAKLSDLKHKGVIKNDRMRRDILKDFEAWAKQHFVVVDKADSEIAGAKGNLERFYLLKPVIRP